MSDLSAELVDAVIDLDLGRVKLLISQGAKVNQLLEDGFSLVHEAITSEAERYGTESWEATRLERPEIPEPTGSILRELLVAGADPNFRGPDVRSALEIAREYNHQPAVALLVEHGAKT